MNNDIVFFIGEPLEFQKGIKIFPPKLKDVVTNKHFSVFLKLLTISQEEIEDECVNKKIDLKDMLTPLETLINLSYNDKKSLMLVKEAFKFFLHEEVFILFEKKVIIVGDLKKSLSEIKDVSELKLITEENYFDFQNLIRESCGIKSIEPPNPNEHWKIKQMKARARYRDKIKAKQQSKNGLDLKSALVAICCMGLGITPLNIGEISYCAISLIMRTFQEREKYDVDIKSVMAGAKKVKPKYWIRKIDD